MSDAEDVIINATMLACRAEVMRLLDTHGAPAGDSIETRLEAWAAREEGWIGRAHKALATAERLMTKLEQAHGR